MKKITGTFIDEITADIPPQNWGKEDWIREFDTMKATGLDTVINIRAGLWDMAFFPSKVLGITDVPDLAQLFLDQCERCGIKFFFGCHTTGNLYVEWDSWREDWEINKKFLPEVIERYGDHPAFQGWYISPETVKPGTKGSLEIYSRYSDYMKELKDLPVLVSPGYPSLLYKEDTPEWRHRKFVDGWDKVFSKAKSVDIVAFQDGSCGYERVHDRLFELEDYYKETQELCKTHNLTMWANCETFSWHHPIKFPPIDWRYLKRRMALASKYAEKLITFEFSHFLSPNSMHQSARNLYKRYMEDIIGDGNWD